MARSAVSVRTDFFDDAACRTVDTDVFFPRSDAAAADAKAICAACPVREACLEFAIQTRQAEGVWGGQTPLERHRTLRRRQKAARKVREREAALAGDAAEERGDPRGAEVAA